MFEKIYLFANQTKLTTWRKITRRIFFENINYFAIQHLADTDKQQPNQRWYRQEYEKKRKNQTNIVSFQTKSFGPWKKTRKIKKKDKEKTISFLKNQLRQRTRRTEKEFKKDFRISLLFSLPNHHNETDEEHGEQKRFKANKINTWTPEKRQRTWRTKKM